MLGTANGGIMRQNLFILVCSALLITGCSQISGSRFNPLNWFGSSQTHSISSQPNTALPALLPAGSSIHKIENRQLIQNITDIAVLTGATGGILRATGKGISAGHFNAELVLISIQNGVATYDFLVETPAMPDAGQTQITVATPLDVSELSHIRQFIVRGATNRMKVSR